MGQKIEKSLDQRSAERYTNITTYFNFYGNIFRENDLFHFTRFLA